MLCVTWRNALYSVLLALAAFAAFAASAEKPRESSTLANPGALREPVSVQEIPAATPPPDTAPTAPVPASRPASPALPTPVRPETRPELRPQPAQRPTALPGSAPPQPPNRELNKTPSVQQRTPVPSAAPDLRSRDQGTEPRRPQLPSRPAVPSTPQGTALPTMSSPMPSEAKPGTALPSRMPRIRKITIDTFDEPGRRIAFQGPDCDDNDPDRGPGLQEVCDNKDNDCDGDVDENVAQVFYEDRDRDGHGNPSRPVYACSSRPGIVSDGNDCDDNDRRRTPANGCD